jgi:hypothetical protein
VTEITTDDIWTVTPENRQVHAAVMYLKFKHSIARNYDLLLKLERREALHQVAWLTRNLLELDVWVEYCSQSEDKARAFWEDAIRDTHSLLDPKAEHDPEFQDLVTKATGLLSDDRGPSAWQRVSKAAESIGRGDYGWQNRWLSKFVHPTAMSVILPLPLKNQKALQSHFVVMGKEFGAAAKEKLGNSFMASRYERYKPLITRMKKDPKLRGYLGF